MTTTCECLLRKTSTIDICRAPKFNQMLAGISSFPAKIKCNLPCAHSMKEMQFNFFVAKMAAEYFSIRSYLAHPLAKNTFSFFLQFSELWIANKQLENSEFYSGACASEVMRYNGVSPFFFPCRFVTLRKHSSTPTLPIPKKSALRQRSQRRLTSIEQ